MNLFDQQEFERLEMRYEALKDKHVDLTDYVEELEGELETADKVIRVVYSALYSIAPKMVEALVGESRYLAKVVNDEH